MQLSNWFITAITDYRILIELFIDCKEPLMCDIMLGLIKIALKILIDCKK